MSETKTNFVPVGVLDPRAASPVTGSARAGTAPSNQTGRQRGPTRMELIRGLVRQAPFVGKNFALYFRNGWRRHVLQTKIVAPYAVTIYVTHKCNLACSYCTQKEPDVFSQELPTAGTLKVLAKIRQETDSIVITGGEPTLRSDIETIVEAARFKNKFRSVLLITNGTLLDRKPKILDGVTGLVVSLDALQADPTNPLSKPAALPKVM
jgi:biotin synthase-like enzyme